MDKKEDASDAGLYDIFSGQSSGPSKTRIWLLSQMRDRLNHPPDAEPLRVQWALAMVGASSTARSLGKSYEAEQMAKRAKETLEVLFGDGSYEIITDTEQLAEAYFAQGRYN